MPRPATPPYGERELRLGPAMSGLDVWELQIKLIAWGSGTDADGIGVPNQPVIVHGKYDRATADAVKRFQHALTLPVTGIVNDATFRAIDKEAALQPLLVHELRCPCAAGKNATPIRCRCCGTGTHPSEGVCTGFGNGRFSGQFILDGVTLPDGVSLATEQLDVYDMREYPGVDKALIWAIRGLMRRAAIARAGIVAGYRCWHDNYHHTDLRRLRHRRSTFHLGKTVELYHLGSCAEYGQNPTAVVCATCTAIRKIALEKCGFQHRWQQPDRVSVGETGRDGPPPFNPHAVIVSTVRRRDRKDDDFVNTYHASLLPLYPAKAESFSYPVDLGAGIDVAAVPGESYFQNIERGPHGWFPVGVSRIWHGGVHIFAGAGAEVKAMADGEVVGCRAGEAETARTFGSRNFVLLRHTHDAKVWYSLYMHLDNGAIGAASTVPWRKALHARTVDHILLKAPAPAFLAEVIATKNRLTPKPGFAAGERPATEAAAAAADPRAALDADAPLNSLVIKLAAPADTYAFTQMETVVLADIVAADAALGVKITANDIIAVDPPIKVNAGELLGMIGAAPTDPVLVPGGAFLHWETFSTVPILAGDGYPLLDIATAAKATDRADVVAKLQGAGALTGITDKVFVPIDRTAQPPAVDLLELRSAVLKMTSHWDLGWKASLQASTPMSFMADPAIVTLGDLMEEYRWWAGINLAGGSTVYHYHPVTFLLQLVAKSQA